MSKKLTTPKYRPVLTAAQIQHILALAKTEHPSISQASMSLIATLAPFAAKIDNAGITAAYSTTPKQDLLSSLGGDAPAAPSHISASSNNQAALMSKEEVWELAYNKYQSCPAACSLQEIRDSKEYAYLNDLMSAEEVAEFEAASSDIMRDPLNY